MRLHHLTEDFSTPNTSMAGADDEATVNQAIQAVVQQLQADGELHDDPAMLQWRGVDTASDMAERLYEAWAGEYGEVSPELHQWLYQKGLELASEGQGEPNYDVGPPASHQSAWDNKFGPQGSHRHRGGY